MHRLEHTTEIAAPREVVWEWLVQPDRLPQWVGGMTRFQPLTDGGPRAGARSRETVVIRGKAWDTESEILRFEPTEALEVRTRAKGFDSLARYRLDEDGDRTRLTARVDTTFSMLVARLLGGVVTREAQKKLESDLARLKELAERAS